MITQKGRFLIRHEETDSGHLEKFDFEKLEEKYQEIKAFYSSLGLIPRSSAPISFITCSHFHIL